MKAGTLDVYQYESVPLKIRVQTVQIILCAIGPFFSGVYQSETAATEVYGVIVRHLRREQGVHRLVQRATNDLSIELFNWLEIEGDIDLWLDGLEICLRSIDMYVRDNLYSFQDITTETPDHAIAEINARLLEASVGYQYAAGDIVRVDSTLVHKEIVLPALALLSEPAFSSADQEFRDAHQAYRYGEYSKCLLDCAKALESVLKIIGTRRKWSINATDPASKLIQAAKTAGFLAGYHEAATNHLVGLLSSSVPAVRNRLAGHGAGTETVVIPQHLAAFQLQQTAVVLLYLMQHDASLP